MTRARRAGLITAATFTAALTVSAAAGCGSGTSTTAGPAPTATHTTVRSQPQATGEVTARQETRFTPHTCGAGNQQRDCQTYVSDTLEVTDKTGRVHTLKVTPAVERHCGLRALYPDCAKKAAKS